VERRSTLARFGWAVVYLSPLDTHALSQAQRLHSRQVQTLAADVDQLGTDHGHQVVAVTAKGGRRRVRARGCWWWSPGGVGS